MIDTVGPRCTAKAIERPIKKKKTTIEIVERRTTFVWHQDVIDVGIERCSRGGKRTLVDDPVPRNRAVVTLSRHAGKSDNAAIRICQEPGCGRCHRPTVQAAAQIHAHITSAAKPTLYRLV